jgi:mRNA-degrading endonuclease RelE of RelBE toxin-antitoxin system
LALEIKLTATAQKYFEKLDKPTRKRIQEKLDAIAAAPFDPRLSKPLVDASKRTARVGDYRILFEVLNTDLFVSDIAPRGRAYRKLNR